MWISAVLSGIGIVHVFGVCACADWNIHLSSSIPIDNVDPESAITELVDTVVGISVFQCVQQCHQSPDCEFINYRFVANLCQFIRHVDKDAPLHTGYRKGYACWSKNDWDITATETAISEPTTDTTTTLSTTTDTTTTLSTTTDTTTTLSTTTDTTTTLSTTTDTVTTQAEAPICPPGFTLTSYSTAVLEDGTSVSYRVILSPTREHGGADDNCVENDAEYEAHLFHVSTNARLQFIFNLTSCSAFANTTQLWVDGIQDGGIKNWNETTMPYISEHWEATPADGKCASVHKDFGFKMTAETCGASLPYICEKI